MRATVAQVELYESFLVLDDLLEQLNQVLVLTKGTIARQGDLLESGSVVV